MQLPVKRAVDQATALGPAVNYRPMTPRPSMLELGLNSYECDFVLMFMECNNSAVEAVKALRPELTEQAMHRGAAMAGIACEATRLMEDQRVIDAINLYSQWVIDNMSTMQLGAAMAMSQITNDHEQPAKYRVAAAQALKELTGIPTLVESRSTTEVGGRLADVLKTAIAASCHADKVIDV